MVPKTAAGFICPLQPGSWWKRCTKSDGHYRGGCDLLSAYSGSYARLQTFCKSKYVGPAGQFYLYCSWNAEWRLENCKDQGNPYHQSNPFGRRECRNSRRYYFIY